MTRFNFYVEQGWADDAETVPADTWRVGLPHQCDSWLITREDDKYGGPTTPHAVAVERMTEFVAEAQAALAALLDRREMDET